MPRDQAQGIQLAATIAEILVKVSYTTTFAMSAYTGALSHIWAMVNEMQLLAYIFYMNLYMPGNASQFFEFLIEISEFTFFDTS